MKDRNGNNAEGKGSNPPADTAIMIVSLSRDLTESMVSSVRMSPLLPSDDCSNLSYVAYALPSMLEGRLSGRPMLMFPSALYSSTVELTVPMLMPLPCTQVPLSHLAADGTGGAGAVSVEGSAGGWQGLAPQHQALLNQVDSRQAGWRPVATAAAVAIQALAQVTLRLAVMAVVAVEVIRAPQRLPLWLAVMEGEAAAVTQEEVLMACSARALSACLAEHSVNALLLRV